MAIFLLTLYKLWHFDNENVQFLVVQDVGRSMCPSLETSDLIIPAADYGKVKQLYVKIMKQN